MFFLFCRDFFTIFALDLPAANIIAITLGFFVIVERPIVITNRLREISIPPRSDADVACVSKLVSKILVVEL